MNTQKTSLTTCQLNSFAVIQISGVDSIKFLQGQISINAESIQENRLALAALCNPQGRCVSLFYATKKAHIIYFFLPKDLLSSSIEHLKKYAVFSKVVIDDCSDTTLLYGLNQSPHESEVFEDNIDLAHWPEKNIAIAFTANSNDTSTHFTQIDHVDESQWLELLIERQIPWLSLSKQAQFLPHNLNLPGLKAVDFKKGCFTGQEVIARMQYKGKLKSHMQSFKGHIDSIPEDLDYIFSDNNKAAEVICWQKNQQNIISLLAVTKDRYLDHKNFRLGSENGPILKLVDHNP